MFACLGDTCSETNILSTSTGLTCSFPKLCSLKNFILEDTRFSDAIPMRKKHRFRTKLETQLKRRRKMEITIKDKMKILSKKTNLKTKY